VRPPRQQRQRGRSCAIAHNEAAPLREMLAEAIRNTAKPPKPTHPPKLKRNAA